jgi:hypothetical protein
MLKARCLTGILPPEVSTSGCRMAADLVGLADRAWARDLRAASSVSNMDKLYGRTIQSRMCFVRDFGSESLTPPKRML